MGESADCFLDTNVLLYAISRAPAEAGKRQRARELLARPGWMVSCQVLQEFYVQATRPRDSGALTHAEAAAIVQQLLEMTEAVAVTPRLVRQALVVKARHGLCFWDAAIMAAASLARRSVVYSEDLAHGQDYDGVRVLNPFLA
jgi:predicted nucleic acid-binding protein